MTTTLPPKVTTLPGLCTGLVLLPFPGGFLIEGGVKRVLLKGAAATETLPRVLPLLDGRHPVTRIAELSAITPAQVNQLISLLRGYDLIEDVTADAVQESSPKSHVTDFLSRSLGATRIHRSAAEVQATMAGCAVLVLATPTVAVAVRDDLADTGVGAVVVGDSGASVEDTIGAARSTGRPRSLILVQDGMVGHPIDALERACRAARIPLLRFATARDRIEIGPLFYPGTTCYRCFSRGRVAMDWPDPDGPDTSVDGFAAALASSEVLAVLAQTTKQSSFRKLTRTSMPDLVTDEYLVTGFDDCVECFGSYGPTGDGPDYAAAYEWQVERLPVELRPKLLNPPSPAGLETAREFFPTSPVRALPRPTSVTPVRGVFGTPAAVDQPRAEPLDELTVTGLLMRVAGQRLGGHELANQRWTPSGGNLGSVELYVMTRNQIFGDLPGSVFRYDDLQHSLIALDPVAVPLEDCLGDTDLPTPQVAIVMVGAANRIQPKYDRFRYRLTHLDAGVAAAQLGAVADGYGLDVRFAAGWGAGLAESLKLLPQQELIGVVAGLYERDPACP